MWVGNVFFGWTYPTNLDPVTTVSFNGFNITNNGTTAWDTLIVAPGTNNTWVTTYDLKTRHYAEVQQSQNYSFNLAPANVYSNLSGGLSTGYYSKYVIVEIKRLDGTVVQRFSASTPTAQLQATVYLCKGIYMIESQVNVQYQLSPGIPICCPVRRSGLDNFTFSCLNYSTTAYKSLTTQNECVYTVPMAAKDSMLNPVFTPPAGKKMWFSAWVRETCGNPSAGTPCNSTSYTSNSITLSFGNAGSAGYETFIPSGPIIDGWQRVEGEFVVPAGVSKMTLQLKNYNSTTYTSTGTTYSMTYAFILTMPI